MTMQAQNWLDELQNQWFPHTTDSGLARLIHLVEDASPYLVHGMFTHAVPRGCIATHLGWHHPKTTHLTLDAGVIWLTKVAGLNPATSKVIRLWDQFGVQDFDFRCQFLHQLKAEQARRRSADKPVNRVEAFFRELAV
jgi:hypothetical protein